MAQKSGLSVRQHKRKSVRLPVRFDVSDEHRTQVRFTSSSTASNQYSLFGVAADVSRGGLGMESRLYLPRMCEGTIRIYPQLSADWNEEQLRASTPVITARVKVRRVILSSHEPSYSIGMAFIDPPEDLDGLISELIRPAQDGEPDRPEPGEDRPHA